MAHLDLTGLDRLVTRLNGMFVEKSRQINNKPLSGDIDLTAADMSAQPALPASAEGSLLLPPSVAGGRPGALSMKGLTSTISQLLSPGFRHVFAEKTRTINGKPLSGDITLTAANMGAQAAIAASGAGKLLLAPAAAGGQPRTVDQDTLATVAALPSMTRPIVGTYTRDGNSIREIPLGFRPSFGIVFAVDEAPMAIGSNGKYALIYLGVFSSEGNTDGVTWSLKSFNVRNNTGTTTGRNYRALNTSGFPYVYAVWR